MMSLLVFQRVKLIPLLLTGLILSGCGVWAAPEVDYEVNILAETEKVPLLSARWDRNLGEAVRSCLTKMEIQFASLEEGYLEHRMMWYQPTPGGTAIPKWEYVDVPAFEIYEDGKEEASFLLSVPPISLWKPDSRRYMELRYHPNPYTAPVKIMVQKIVSGEAPC